MAVFITEHTGRNNYRQTINQSPLVSYLLSSASGSVFPQAGTGYIRVVADAGSFLAIGNTSSTTTLTSTNAFRISANQLGEEFAVSTASRIVAQST